MGERDYDYYYALIDAGDVYGPRAGDVPVVRRSFITECDVPPIELFCC